MSHYGTQQFLVQDRQQTLLREAANDRLARMARTGAERPARPRVGVLGRVLTPVISFLAAGRGRRRHALTTR
jgi:hypothetical protein